MRKIPTLFRRDPEDMRRVTSDVHPDCRWVLDGEGVATRKYDGTCVRSDGERWWTRHPTWEGVVWHHPDGRMAKLKRRDFPSGAERPTSTLPTRR